MNDSISPEPFAQGPRLDPRQQQTVEGLIELDAPELADVYVGAVGLMSQPTFPGASRFVAHALREIIRALPRYVDIPIPQRLDCTKRLNALAEDFRKAGFMKPRPVGPVVERPLPDAESALSVEPTVSVPASLFARIQALIRDHVESVRFTQRRRLEDSIVKLDVPQEPMQSAHVRPMISQLMRIREWAEGYAHLPGPGGHAAPSRQECISRFQAFEAALHSLVAAFYAGLGNVDRVLYDANRQPWLSPTPGQVTYAIMHITKREYYRRFFNRLENPRWVVPLHEACFFAEPPPPESHEEEGTIGFPEWPESRYLARMAQHVPDDVIGIIISMPETTDNPRVQEDWVEAAMAMPGPLAVRIVPLARKWMRSPYLLLLPQKLGYLIPKLANDGQVNAAFDLADHLLELISRPRTSIAGLRPEVWPRFHPWQYEEILRDAVPALLKADALKAAKLLCDKLEAAITIENADGGPETSDDFSRIWRPHIGGATARGQGDVKDWLIDAIRDGAVNVAAQDAELARRLLDDLESRRYSIFRRIALHVLCELPDLDPQRTEARLSDRALLEDWWMWPEHARLMESHFGSLDAELQRQVLRWIDEGPELPPDESPEDAQERLGYWQLQRLKAIRASLDPEWQARYEALEEESGEPKVRDLADAIAAVTATALARMSGDEVIGLLRSWRPHGDPRGQTPRDLGEALRAAVSENSEQFAALAPAFKEDVDPTYVGGLLFGLQQACNNKSAFDWAPVLNLCEHIARRPRAHTPLSEHPSDADHDWGRARYLVASLISAGLHTGGAEIPFGMRPQVWRTLEPLARDPDPTPEREKSHESRDATPYEFAAGTVRGNALQGIVLYALWCLRNTASSGGQERHVSLFEEIKAVLQLHLDPTLDPSPAVRATYGRYLPYLFLIDKSWAESALPLILPDDPSMARLRQAAWQAYLLTNPAYDAIFEMLEPYYRAAVLGIGQDDENGRLANRIAETLGYHLFAFYVRGKYPLDPADSLLRLFFERVSSRQRAQAIGNAGSHLSEEGTQFSADKIERLRGLWEFRLRAASASPDAESVHEELAQFGFWFASGVFDPSWSLDAFERTLQATGGRISDWKDVCQHLCLLTPAAPSRVMRCVWMMVEGDPRRWNIAVYPEETRELLRAVLSSTDQDARRTACKLINRLGARGIHDFQDLLKLGEP